MLMSATRPKKPYVAADYSALLLVLFFGWLTGLIPSTTVALVRMFCGLTFPFIALILSVKANPRWRRVGFCHMTRGSQSMIKRIRRSFFRGFSYKMNDNIQTERCQDCHVPSLQHDRRWSPPSSLICTFARTLLFDLVTVADLPNQLRNFLIFWS